jgi:hypothetical protein
MTGHSRASLFVLGFLAAGCATDWVDAVTSSPEDGGGSSTSGDDGGGLTTWPNATSSANSDPWLVANHDRLTQMKPRLLVVDFYDGPAEPADAGSTSTVPDPRQLAQAQIDAIADGSRFHGYADASSPAFLNYELVKLVDLTDHPRPAGWPYVSSTNLPIDSTGAFDPSQLYTQSFANYYGFPDPNNPSRNLTLCELFETGTINELWLEVGEGGPRAPSDMYESKQVYDENLQPISGTFDPIVVVPCTNGACQSASQCKVSVRIAHLSPTSGVGCDLLVRTGEMEIMGPAIPYLQSNGADFFDDDFAAEDGVSFNSWQELCQFQGDAGAPCVTYSSPTVAQGTYADGTAWKMDPFVQGCGNGHFPANARFAWDYTNTQPVQSRCEHYRMFDGPDGGDLPNLYTSNTVATDLPNYSIGGCSSQWQVYLRQNMPGYGNQARGVDGLPMKNWWPFLFY